MEATTSAETYSPDLEKAGISFSPPASTLAWADLVFTVRGRETPILHGISGQVSSGELLAVMGPSGAGKSTLLDLLCKRVQPSSGQIFLDGFTRFNPQETFSFVEQDDALLGVITVRETVTFAARLSLPHTFQDIEGHVDRVLKSLGLQDVAHNRIGTPIQRGISGGQKRRVTIACSMVAKPKILVLDEPTSGLDAASGREVVTSIRRLAREINTIVICTIHQPNWETYSLFDHLLLLAGGRVMFNGRANALDAYLSSIGSATPAHVNPSDRAIELVNTEFSTQTNGRTATEHLERLASLWTAYASPKAAFPLGDSTASKASSSKGMVHDMRTVLVLSRRNILNYSRNLLAFGIRFAMYAAMGLMLALVWINLGTSTNKINDRLSVHFFSVAFLGFMSVSGIPAFLEERAVFVRERANGLYGPGSFILANTLTSIPFLFACTVVYSLIAYWAIGLHPGGSHFFRFLIYLFLGILAAESQSVLIAAVVPIFVAALALASFANGFWMVVQGYFIKATSLPRFWYYSCHYLDYQTFAFELLVRNDVKGLEFQCPLDAGSCLCPMPSTLPAEQCALAGNDIVVNLGFAGVSDGLYVSVLLIIIVAFRLAMWGALVFKKH